MKYFVLLIFLCTDQLHAQIVNGGFENWEYIGSSEVPIGWNIDTDYSSVIVKDSSSLEGDYSMLLIGGPVVSEGDCLRIVTGKFKLIDMLTDSLFLNFAYKSKSRNSFGRTDFKIGLNGVTIFRSNTEILEYEYYSQEFENPKTDSIFLVIESHRLISGIDGCPDISDHWVDAMAIASNIDLDNDGYDTTTDCDDENPDVNPNQVEEPYNGIDDDCDALTLDDDLDQDGFLLADDCDDENPDVNPNQVEEPYNGIDDDCDALTLDDDLDQDGFLFADDCDDNNADINSEAEEIPNNGIDEDCDGEDLVSSIHQLSNTKVLLYPNPTIDFINIEVKGDLSYQINLYDLSGKLIRTALNIELIETKFLLSGTYLLELKDLKTGNKISERIMKGN